MPDERITVAVTDHATGETDEQELQTYIVLTKEPWHVAYEQRFANGTTQLTIKRATT